jgi:hypothetical protein
MAMTTSAPERTGLGCASPAQRPGTAQANGPRDRPGDRGDTAPAVETAAAGPLGLETRPSLGQPGPLGGTRMAQLPLPWATVPGSDPLPARARTPPVDTTILARYRRAQTPFIRNTRQPPGHAGAGAAGSIMTTLVGLLRRLFSQDVARTNAAQASVRLQHRRRQLDDVDAYLAAQHHRPVQHDDAGGPSTQAVHRTQRRHRAH